MSCDVMFVGLCERPAAPYERIRQLVQGLAQSKQIGALVRVVVYGKERGGSPLLDLPASAQESKRLEPSLLNAQLSESQRNDLAIEGFWEVMRCWPEPGGETSSLGEYRLTITAVGNTFYWPQYRALSSDLVLDAGSARHFAPSIRGNAARQNIEFLFAELAEVVRCGVNTLRGLDEDRSAEPETTFLCFHRTLSGFAKDAGLSAEPTLAEIQAAAAACEQLGVVSLEGGAMVYHRSCIEGSLHEFYSRLKQRA